MIEHLTVMYERLKGHCLVDFELNGTLGSRVYALKPNMAPIRFDLSSGMLPLPLLGLHDKGYIPLNSAVNKGLIIAVFVGSEGFVDNSNFSDITIDWANIDRPDFLWLEMVSRQFRRYEAYRIIREESIPELEQIPDEKIHVGPAPYSDIFKLHS